MNNLYYINKITIKFESLLYLSKINKEFLNLENIEDVKTNIVEIDLIKKTIKNINSIENFEDLIEFKSSLEFDKFLIEFRKTNYVAILKDLAFKECFKDLNKIICTFNEKDWVSFESKKETIYTRTEHKVYINKLYLNAQQVLLFDNKYKNFSNYQDIKQLNTDLYHSYMNDCGNVTINLETNELVIHSETDEINPKIDFLRFSQVEDIYEIIDNYKKFGYVIILHNFLSEYTFKDGFNILCSFDTGNLYWNKYSAS